MRPRKSTGPVTSELVTVHYILPSDTAQNPPPGPPMKARRPYLLRAIHEWITDSLCTPHIVVDAGDRRASRCRAITCKDGKIVLNVSWTATANLRHGNDEVSFSGRFGGASMSVRVPIGAVLAIYARETGQGMIFADEDVRSARAAGDARRRVRHRTGRRPPFQTNLTGR